MYIYIGKLMGTHGLKGELKLKTSFEYINNVFKEDFSLYIGDSKEKYSFLKVRKHNDLYLVTLKNLENIDLVLHLKNKNVYALKSDLCLKEDQFVFEDFINLKAYNGEKYLGVIDSIDNYGLSNNVFLIKGKKEILIPYNKKFIDKVILNDKIIFKEVEGIIDAN